MVSPSRPHSFAWPQGKLLVELGQGMHATFSDAKWLI